MHRQLPGTRPVCKRTLFGAAVVGLAAALASPASAATSTTPYGAKTVPSPVVQQGARWGERMASTFADYNGDGRNDVFTATPSENVGTVSDQGRVRLISGGAAAAGTTTVLLTIDSPEPQAAAHFGFFISVPGDLTGDGKPEVVSGTDAQDVGANTDQGKAWVFNGATGAVLFALDNPFPQSFARFGSRVGRAGDINADGKADIIVGASNNDVPAGCGEVEPLPSNCRIDQGQAFIFSGANGALLRTLDLPAADQRPAPCTASCGNLGLAVQGPGDVGTVGTVGNAGPLDGVTDQLVDAGSLNGGTMYVFSGANGGVIHKITDPEPANNGGFFGFQDAAPLSPGDVGSLGSTATDGYAEIYGNGFLQNGPLVGQGRAWVFDGKTAQMRYVLNDPTPEQGGQFGWSMAGVKFAEHEGEQTTDLDMYIGQSPHHVAGSTGSGGTYVFGGGDGVLVRAFELPAACTQPSTPTNLGPNLGWSLAAPGDLTGDGEPDLLAGAPFTDVNGVQDQGLAFAFISNSTATVTTCQ